ncbi:MAG TPA: tetratricopeptide repeat protein, partial [Chitinophagales bacterium]|nr:tetratricopeptide repeat protein [Chitinophagales bacterium]
MIKKLIPPFLLFCFFSFAQEKLPFIDFQELSKLAAESSQSGDYDKTLAIFNKVNKNDSAYCSVMISKSYYLMALKKYDEAIDMADKGIKKNCGDLRASFYINKGVALLNQKKYVEATEVFDEGITNYPKNNIFWYNKGVTLESQGEIEEAVKAYQTSIILNPFYRKAYLQLGNICYKQELVSQALMCFNMYILLEPDAENAFSILNSLDNILKNKNENSKNPSLIISKDDEAFEEIDLVIN